MSSKAGSSIGAFLMSMPVSAMVLMGVFGVPRFSSGTGGESGWQNAKQFFTSLGSNGSEAVPGRPQFPGLGDPNSPPGFAESEAPQWGHPSDGQAPQAAPEWPASSGSSAETLAPRNHSINDAHPLISPHGGNRATAQGPATISWQDARRRLADLGISEFHLEPGLQGDHYLFVCLLTPGSDERVTRRFEAEAPEPLAAVETVLGQIDQWLAQQYAQENRSPSPFGSR
jgi:hypothetical protein